MTPEEELGRQIAAIITARYVRPDSVFLEADSIAAAKEIIKNWTVTRKSTGGREGPDGSYLKIDTAWRPETDEERAYKEERVAAYMWTIGATPSLYEDEDLYRAYHSSGPTPDGSPDPGPPPARTRMISLLEQRVWWMQKNTDENDVELGGPRKIPIRVDDMDHSHRMNLLNWLWRHAQTLKFNDEFQLLASITGPAGPRGEMAQDACDHEMAELQREPLESWFERQPLVLELRYRTTPWGESPSTWHSMCEYRPHRRFDRKIVVRHRVDEHGFSVGTEGDVEHGRVEEAIVERGYHDVWRLYEPRSGEAAQVSDLLALDPIEWRELTNDESDRVSGWWPFDEAPRGGGVIVVRLTCDGNPELVVSRYVLERRAWSWVTVPHGFTFDETAPDESEWQWRSDVHNYCEHVGYEESDCEICESTFHPCGHGGMRDADYCYACKQE